MDAMYAMYATDQQKDDLSQKAQVCAMQIRQYPQGVEGGEAEQGKKCMGGHLRVTICIRDVTHMQH